MNFRTQIKPTEYPFSINHKNKMLFLGSCFTESIGNKLLNSKFDIDINPFGILYNPISVKQSLEILTVEDAFTEDNIFFYNEQWHSSFHHGKFSRSNKETMLAEINNRLKFSGENLKNAKYLFITFGTAWVYEDIKTNRVVANCHKLPSKQFRRRLLNADEITVEYFQLLNSLSNYNPDINIILTVSPIRHFKDGFNENQISKSTLHIAINQIQEHFNNVFYFPSFEIMIDDLRDYRFYENDMLHPNETAINYIFDYFSNSFFSKSTKDLILKIDEVVKAKNHRPFNQKSESYKKFVSKMYEKTLNLQENNKHINFTEELNYFE